MMVCTERYFEVTAQPTRRGSHSPAEDTKVGETRLHGASRIAPALAAQPDDLSLGVGG